MFNRYQLFSMSFYQIFVSYCVVHECRMRYLKRFHFSVFTCSDLSEKSLTTLCKYVDEN